MKNARKESKNMCLLNFATLVLYLVVLKNENQRTYEVVFHLVLCHTLLKEYVCIHKKEIHTDVSYHGNHSDRPPTILLKHENTYRESCRSSTTYDLWLKA